MLAADLTADPPAAVPNRRSVERFPVITPGRYTFDGGAEHSCVTENISGEGVGLRGRSIPRVGARIVCDLRHIGRLHGACIRRSEAGFVMSIESASMPLNLIASRLMRLADDQEASSTPRRIAERIAPLNCETFLTVEDGSSYRAKVINVSQTGIAFSAPVRPEVDSMIVVGHQRARVVRHFAEGVGAAFLVPLPAELVAARFGGGPPHRAHSETRAGIARPLA